MSLDARQRAMLEEMGVRLFWPEAPAEAPPAIVEEPVRPRAPAPSAPAPQPVARSGVEHMEWDALQQAVAACRACKLCEGRTNTVFGVGDTQADWLLVGEAPGENEDRLGEPFVGQAGKLLDNMLGSLGLSRREQVYIANVLKCRPPNNRTPEPLEVDACRPYLERQIALIQPRLIVALGRSAATTLLNVDASIASLRGRVHRLQGRPLIVTYHPAYLLRNLPDKAKAWEDLLFARRVLRESAGV